jgi:hypothetical protein
MPLQKSTRTKTVASARTSPSAKQAAAPAAPAVSLETASDTGRMIGAGAVLLVVCVMAAAMLLAARESSVPGTKTTSAAMEPETSVASADGSAKSPAPVSMARTATNAPAAATTKAASPKSSTVTITGCLQRGDETFRLTDTDGSDAPRARSWKTGFLKKGPATIEVTDAANRLRMASHVGQRVSVTGLLEDRQMQARSLRRIAPACE